jgi:hypothetical protein
MRPVTSNEVAAIKMRHYYAANKEKVKARAYAWRAANREKYVSYQKDYSAKHPEKRKAAMAAYYQRNKETLKAKAKAWQQANKDKVRGYRLARLARLSTNA